MMFRCGGNAAVVISILALQANVSAAFTSSAKRSLEPPSHLNTAAPHGRSAQPSRAVKHRTNGTRRNLFGRKGDEVSTTDIISLSGDSMLTPEGFGFSSPIRRILKLAGRGAGYYRAKGMDRVVDVMDAVTDGNQDAALVFDGGSDKLLGIFTESDYIKFSTARAVSASSEEESANFLACPVSDFVTPVSELVSLSSADGASQAIAAMKQDSVRHLIVADKVSPENRLLEDSVIEGVINMQDVMNIVQKDERLTVDKLTQKYPNLGPLEQIQEEIKSYANDRANESDTGKTDLIRSGTAALSLLSVGAFSSQSPWLHEHADIAMIAIFVIGYLGIIFEEVFEFNKAAVALLMSTGLWVTYADYFSSTDGIASEGVVGQLAEQLAEVSDICFFLLAASAIVEVVDAHQGFKVVTNQIKTTSKKTLFWTIGFITFFLSAILNNLTVTIVMVSLLRKLVPNGEDRRLFGAMVVVAANAGGVWTPIGDVTTTMLWINNQLSTLPTIVELFLPSVVCLVASLAFLVRQVEEDGSLEDAGPSDAAPLADRGKLVFGFGIAALLSVPVFAELTGLPPYLAMLTGLGAIWTLTDVIHMGEDADEGMKVPAALSKLDTAGILFFLGILMSIGALDKSGLLKELAVFLNQNLPNLDIIATVIGLASALIDNVPLVAATMGMYDLSDFATDDKLWQLIALCAGTGGSILVIGSASGVALMGLEKVDFLWYAKKVSIGAAVGYFAGIAAYLAQNAVLGGGMLNLNSLLPQAVAITDVAQNTGVM